MIFPRTKSCIRQGPSVSILYFFLGVHHIFSCPCLLKLQFDREEARRSFLLGQQTLVTQPLTQPNFFPMSNGSSGPCKCLRSGIYPALQNKNYRHRLMGQSKKYSSRGIGVTLKIRMHLVRSILFL